MGGAGGTSGNLSGEAQVNENGPEGAGLVGLEASTSSLVFFPVKTLFIDSCSTSSVSRDREEILVFRRKYPPSVRIVALGILQPFNLPFKLPVLVILYTGLPTSATAMLTFQVDVALNGIFLFFLFFKLKSSLPTLDTVDPASSPSSSESEVS